MTAAAEEHGLTREQHEARAQGLGGSDAPIVAGVSDRMTALELYFLKRGEFEQDEDDGDLLSWLGHQAEPILARWYQERTGRRVQRCNRTLVHREHDWMLGHVDRLVVGEPRLLEFKMRVHGRGWGPDGSDEIPDDVRVQVQHYLAVTGREAADVVAFISGRDIRLYPIPRDEALIERLIDIEQEFWLGVELGQPPALDHAHPSAHELMQILYPGTNGQIVPLDAAAVHWAQVLEEATELRRRYQRVRDEARAHLLEQLGEAAIGQLPDGSDLRRKVHADGYVNLRRYGAPRIDE